MTRRKNQNTQQNGGSSFRPSKGYGGGRFPNPPPATARAPVPKGGMANTRGRTPVRGRASPGPLPRPPSQPRGRQNRGPSRGRSASRGGPRGRSLVRSENSRVRNPPNNFRTKQGEAPIVRDANAVAPNRVTTILATKSPVVIGSPLHYLCAMLVAKYDSLCPGKLGYTIAPTDGVSYEPVQLMGALILVCLSYFKKVGIFTNQTLAQTLVEIPADAPVPTVLAKMLQYYAPWTSPEGVEFDCQDNSTALPAVTTVSGAITTTASGWLEKGPLNVYGSTGATGSTEYQGVSGSGLSNLANITPYLGTILDLFGSCMPCIEYAKIPTRAPDGSVHVNVDTTAYIATSASRSFDPEVALFLCESNVSGNTIWGSHKRPLPNVGSPGTSRGLLNVQTGQGGLFIGWIETLSRCKWSNGTVRAMLGTCDLGKLSSYCVELFDMDVRNWHRLITAQILQVAGDADDDHNIATQPSITELDAHVIATMLESALIARLGEFTHLSFPLNQCRVYDSTLKSLQLPPWVGVFLWALGPVIREGRLRLVLPYNVAANNHWFNYTAGKTYAQQGDGSQGLFQGLFATNVVDAIIIDGINLTTTINSVSFSLTPVKYTQLYEPMYNSALGYSKAAVARGITADLNKTLGAVPNLAYVNYQVGNVNPGSLYLTYTGAGTSTHQIYAPGVTAIASDAPLSRSDAMLAAFLGIVSAPPIGTQSNRLMTYQTNLSNLVNLVPTLVASQDGDDFTQSLAAVRARVAKFYSINGQSMDHDAQGNAMIAALASVAGPMLANLMPQVANWAIGKVTGQSDPSARGDIFSDFGTIVKNGKNILDSGMEMYNLASKTGLINGNLKSIGRAP